MKKDIRLIGKNLGICECFSDNFGNIQGSISRFAACVVLRTTAKPSAKKELPDIIHHKTGGWSVTIPLHLMEEVVFSAV